MIHRVYRSQLDLVNLSLKRTSVMKKKLNPDYRKVVIKKPWGYEFLLFENEHIAAWVLHLKEGASTSMHCHPKKRTSLAVLSGEVTTSTLDNRFPLGHLDGIIIENSVFHSTQATSPGGAFIIEIETPPDKNDLVRLNDRYGRENKGYEGVSEMSRKLVDYEYCDFHGFKPKFGAGLKKMIRNSQLKLDHNKSYFDLFKKIRNSSGFLLCLLDNKLCHSENGIISNAGDIISSDDLLKHDRGKISVIKNFSTLTIFPIL